MNSRISNHNQTFSDALNVLLAFPHNILGLYKQGYHFLSALLQLLFSRGGTLVWILRESSVEMVSFVELKGTLMRVPWIASKRAIGGCDGVTTLARFRGSDFLSTSDTDAFWALKMTGVDKGIVFEVAASAV